MKINYSTIQILEKRKPLIGYLRFFCNTKISFIDKNIITNYIIWYIMNFRKSAFRNFD